MDPGAADLEKPSMRRMRIKRNDENREMRDGMESRCSGRSVVGTTMKKPMILYVSAERWPSTACSESPRRTIHAMERAKSSKQNLGSVSASVPVASKRTYRVSTNNRAFHPNALIPRSLYP